MAEYNCILPCPKCEALSMWLCWFLEALDDVKVISHTPAEDPVADPCATAVVDYHALDALHVARRRIIEAQGEAT